MTESQTGGISEIFDYIYNSINDPELCEIMIDRICSKIQDKRLAKNYLEIIETLKSGNHAIQPEWFVNAFMNIHRIFESTEFGDILSKAYNKNLSDSVSKSIGSNIEQGRGLSLEREVIVELETVNRMEIFGRGGEFFIEVRHIGEILDLEGKNVLYTDGFSCINNIYAGYLGDGFFSLHSEFGNICGFQLRHIDRSLIGESKSYIKKMEDGATFNFGGNSIDLRLLSPDRTKLTSIIDRKGIINSIGSRLENIKDIFLVGLKCFILSKEGELFKYSFYDLSIDKLFEGPFGFVRNHNSQILLFGRDGSMFIYIQGSGKMTKVKDFVRYLGDGKYCYKSNDKYGIKDISGAVCLNPFSDDIIYEVHGNNEYFSVMSMKGDRMLLGLVNLKGETVVGLDENNARGFNYFGNDVIFNIYKFLIRDGNGNSIKLPGSYEYTGTKDNDSVIVDLNPFNDGRSARQCIIVPFDDLSKLTGILIEDLKQFKVYYEIKSLGSGLFLVSLDRSSKYGIVDKNNNTVLDMIFDSIAPKYDENGKLVGLLATYKDRILTFKLN